MHEQSDGPDGPSRPYPAGLGRLREVVAIAAHLSNWRGTAYGLISLLEAATGVSGFRIDDDLRDERGRARPFRIRVHAPAAAEPHRALIRRIVEHEKPAHVVLEPDIVLE